MSSRLKIFHFWQRKEKRICKKSYPATITKKSNVLVFVCALDSSVQKSASCKGPKIKHPIRQPGLLLRIRHLYILLFYRRALQLMLRLQHPAKSVVIYFLRKNKWRMDLFFFFLQSKLIRLQNYRLTLCVFIFLRRDLF